MTQRALLLCFTGILPFTALSAASKKKQEEMGFFNHSFNPVDPSGPIFCVWEAKSGISDPEFQTFIDGPDGPNFDLNALNNTVNKVNTELNGGVTPYPPHFA